MQPAPTPPDSADHGWQTVDWSSHAHDAEVNGRRVHYVDIGTGPPVVLIHGQGAAWQWWLRVIPVLAKDTRIIAIDLAGFGESEPVASGDVFAEQVATVVGLLDHLRIAAATLVGHSMGGLVAQRAACDHPDRVAGLLLIDSGGNTVGQARLTALQVGFRVFNLVFSIPAVPRSIARYGPLRIAFFALATAHPRCVTRQLAQELVPRMASPGFIATMVAGFQAVNQATPQAVPSPALVVWGRQDRIVPLSVGQRLAAEIPDARLVVLDRVGHCAMIEQPIETAALIASFSHDPVNGRPAGEPLQLDLDEQGRRVTNRFADRNGPSRLGRQNPA
ncbi:hypothetical protein BST36_23580 [Mycolicibacterium moriokaense]|uniref:Alpha/beta hydrolase n=1 Tax=Mycolicibacterium moriokaense TaxID=39691 RepID=A0AAD1H869_9MYCO|nr:alpha/beta fold hydrolase [Mycolicibacterium moriokaense]MCV7039139.1 alpha/beta fold hydrolase [Mycolicibacterium moriokaense]ORB18569.1 hypothetical protein BST36_23580 [Mycolicibacterium moriokaense]BBX00041.1 alpha/beta hydrolase [Mycolicibacterium moriokaense]